MANDTATTRLLYAILSQKCLKDVCHLCFISCPLHIQPLSILISYQIDWNKVAHDPILSQEITNGHAARMRYSRFKKQMEGTAPVRRPRNNNSGSPSSSPKKAKVEKNATKSLRKVKERAPSNATSERVKTEASESGYGTAEGTPEAAGHETQNPSAGVIKREHLSSRDENLHLYTPVTPASMSPTPSPGGFTASQDMDEILHSFSMPGHDNMTHEPMGHAQMYPGVMEDPNQVAYGMAIQMPLGMDMMEDPFTHGMWGEDDEHGRHEQERGGESNGVTVKTEERWEDGYRQA
jgi:hypothetical protein